MSEREDLIRRVIRDIEGCKMRIGEERDKLRDLEAELQDLGSNCDRAVDDLQDAADSLSELV